MLTPLRHAILDYIDRLAGDAEGRFQTPVPALSVSRVSQPVMPRHMIYRPTICVVVGRKLCRTIVAPPGCRALERELEPWLR